MYALLLTLLAGCSTTPPSCPQIDGASDCDGDGYGADDCDDIDAAVHPGAADECDGYDDDCDGVDGLQSPWYADEDGDGYGSTSVIACANPGGRVSTGGDCDDTNMAINPGVPEVCDDAEVDEDCSGAADDVDPYTLDASRSEWYPDQDGDGHGDALATPSYSCSAPAGWVSGHTDCDDVSANAHPGLAEICDDGLDNDCDGTANDCSLSDLELATSDAVFGGAGPADSAGYSGAGVGDVDGDGHDDILVGAPNAATYMGAAYLVLGPFEGGYTGLNVADASFSGVGDEAGACVAAAGDLDADGYDDMLVGAYMSDDGGTNAGAVYILRGGPTPISMALATADVVLTGPEEDGRAGLAAQSAGDVNGDGWPDLVIGAFNVGDNDGAAYLVLGGATLASGSLGAAAAMYAGGPDAHAGRSVAGVGDLDGDGYADLLVGAHGHLEGGEETGAAFAVFGASVATSGDLSDEVALIGEATFDHAGRSVAAAGDIDADGYADVLVGAPLNDRGGYAAGAAYLIRGGSAWATKSLGASDAIYTGEAAGDEAGTSVAGVGDTNRDGFDDVLIGAPLNDYDGEDAGSATLVLGGPAPASLSLADGDARLFGWAESFAGWSVAGAGDVDDDGADDILVGAIGANERSGVAFLVLGTGL